MSDMDRLGVKPPLGATVSARKHEEVCAERDSLLRTLNRIAKQGTGTYKNGVLMGATGEPWVHWATLADWALERAYAGS